MHEGHFTHACGAARAGNFTLPGAAASYAPDVALEPTHTEVRLRFDLDAKRAEGTVTTTVRANRAGARALRLDAVALDDVAVTSPAPIDWRYDGESLWLTWKEPCAKGEERVVEISYAVVSPITGMTFSLPDEAYPDRTLFVATDHETERARYWLPCVDYPTVRTSFDFHLTANRDLTILANGTLVGESGNGDGTKTAHWRLEKPCPSYLCCLAIGRFVRFDDEEVEGRPLAYFAADRYEPEDLRRTFGPTPAMMRWIQERLDRPFPYPKYFQIALPGIGGAMENISLVTWDEMFLCDEALRSEWGDFVDQVNIHEMAHSYFGDDVVCRHFEHSWLKESWATYIETVWLEENLSADAGDYDLHVSATTYFREADERYVRPIVTRTYDSSWSLFDAHLYPGGAWRLHMLRSLVGDDAFWSATTDYLESYSGKVVETDDFRRKVEEHSGLNLNRFFDQWLYGKGYPRLKATFKHDAEKDEARLTVEQTQEDEKSGVRLFAFPLDIEIEDDEGKRAITLEIEEKRHTAVFPIRGKPKQVRLDPQSRVLFKLDFNPGDDLLRRTLTERGSVRGRIRAAVELIKTGRRANLQAVKEAMADEPFWGVRCAVAEALGASGAAEAVDPLATMLADEEDARVKRVVARACGAIRDPRLREALQGFLERPQPPWAKAAALESLGAQREESDLDALAKATRAGDRHHVAASGALRGLGSLRSEKAFDLLERDVDYGVLPEPARAASVEGLGRCARLLDRTVRERAAEKLIDLTRDPSERVRLRAAGELAALMAPSAVPALESLKQRHAAAAGPNIDRWIARIRKGDDGEGTVKLRERIEKLEDKLRKLDERVQDFEAREA